MDEISKETKTGTESNSGGHHHHHHHHHSKGGTKGFFEKNKKAVKSVCFLLAIAAVFVVISLLGDKYLIPENEDISSGNESSENISASEEEESSSEPESGIAASIFCVGMPVYNDGITISGKAVMDYFNAPPETYIQDILANYGAEEQLDAAVPVVLNFDIKNIPLDIDISSARVEVSEKADFSNPMTCYLEKNYSVSIPHLKTGTDYFYRLIINFSTGEEAVFESRFSTAEGPRVLSVEGIRNVRDIGGWKTTDGKTIKQGLLFRGTEMDGAVKEDFVLTENGYYTLVSVLGIKTDMDLRWEGEIAETPILGDAVAYKVYDAPGYMAIFDDYGKGRLKEIFSDLAKEEKYPIYMHCTYGADRTGTVCFLLEALLGVSEEDLIKDYELTGLTYSYFSRDIMFETIEMLKTYHGNTMQEKVCSYLLSIGITLEEIEAIQSIFLE